jgi:hypothetical protein
MNGMRFSDFLRSHHFFPLEIVSRLGFLGSELVAANQRRWSANGHRWSANGRLG